MLEELVGDVLNNRIEFVLIRKKGKLEIMIGNRFCLLNEI